MHLTLYPQLQYMQLSLGIFMYDRHGSGLQSFSMDAATVFGLCMFINVLDMHTPQHICGVLRLLDSPVHWRSYSKFSSKYALAVLRVHVLPCFE